MTGLGTHVDSWGTALALTLVVHIGLAQLRVVSEPHDPSEFVAFEIFDLPPLPEVVPEPEAPPPEPDPEPLPPDPEPPIPVSNRPPDPAEPPSDEPPPLVTGIPLQTGNLFDGGMAVRVGNTWSPGHDDDVPLDQLKGFVGAPRVSRHTAPKLLRAYEPPYPEHLIGRGVEGRVTVRVLVGANGRAEDVQLVTGVHPDLDRTAVLAIERFRWRPGRQDEQALPEWVKVTFVFQIKSAGMAKTEDEP